MKFFSRITVMIFLASMCCSSFARVSTRLSRQARFGAIAAFSTPSTDRTDKNQPEFDENWSPWTDPYLEERAEGKHAFRARQHVNPLASKFQKPTVLSPEWPTDVYKDMNRPLFLDIGCARGGFLVDIASQRPDEYNYLGLEIRPIVVHQAQTRVAKHGLEGFLNFVGCNANVDLERLLTIANAKDKVEMVSIQFPDPHFKTRHAKRRVVTPELVLCLAKFMPEGSTIFLQSDIQSVLDDMRFQFRQQPELFQDQVENDQEYLAENMFGIPTEREVSVLERGLPVYRTSFKRTSEVVTASHEARGEDQ